MSAELFKKALKKERARRDLDKNLFESKSRFGGLSLEEVVSSEGLERKTFVIHD